MSARPGQCSGRVLVVDDEAGIVSSIRELLSFRGFEVEGISDSRNTLELVRRFRPDACVLDVRMPYVSGSGLLEAIKKEDWRFSERSWRRRGII